jgi:hypothetical protein
LIIPQPEKSGFPACRLSCLLDLLPKRFYLLSFLFIIHKKEPYGLFDPGLPHL